jgi:hypothetical protein
MTILVAAPILFLSLALALGDAGAQQPKSNSDWRSAASMVKLDYRKNFALDSPDRDDLFRFDQEFQLRWSYRYNDWISFLIEGKVLGEHQIYKGGGGRGSTVDPERGETWARFDQLFGRDLSLKIGRQNFEEPRRWWWMTTWTPAPYATEATRGSSNSASARNCRGNPCWRISPTLKTKASYALARANWRYFKGHGLDFFHLYHHDNSKTQPVGALVRRNREDPSDARLWWGGVRATGSEPIGQYGELSYWADVAVVSGREKLLELADTASKYELVTSRTNRRVQGWAIDLGLRWDSPLPGQPMFTLGYAVGSGDRSPERGSDRAFRQTGLQSDDEEFRTYGEILRPELSNLSIPVLAVRFPIFSKSYVEFAYRHFRQVHAAPFLRDARIEAEPNGINQNIGQEWMLYSLIKQWKKIEIELVGAAFKAGQAYGALSGRMAYSLFTKVTYEF